VSAFRLDLGAGGKRDEGVARPSQHWQLDNGMNERRVGALRQGHRQETAACTGQGMGNVVTLLSCRGSRYGGLIGGGSCCHVCVSCSK